MAFCGNCGSRREPSYKFCPECGSPFQSTDRLVSTVKANVRWEFRDEVIPINFQHKQDFEGWQQLEKVVNKHVLERLKELGGEGWQPEGTTDFQTIRQAGGLKSRYVGFWQGRTLVESVTLRLRRLVQS